jgi:adenosylcobinamide-GDP ribazoletransferase
MTALRDAVAFLTRVPVGVPGRLTPARLGRAAALFPLVGLLVGGVLGGVRILADTVLPPGPSTLLAIFAAILLTGALHEDGLADTADGLGAHVTHERRLEILRDPRIGTYGALALIGSVGLSWSLLGRLDGVGCLQAAVVAHVLARWSFLPQALALRPARADGSGALLRPTRAAAAIATVTAIAATLLVAGPADGVLAVLAAVLAAVVAIAVIRQGLGGATGDTYGAAGKLVEVAVLAVLTAAWTP